MKKFLDLFAKGKRTRDNFYDLYDSSLPDNANHHCSEKNIFKYYPFDSDELGCGILVDSKTKSTINSQECLPQSLSNSHLITYMTDSCDLQPKNDLQFTKNHVDSVNSVMEMEQEEIKCQFEKKKKSNKNIYLINISNSKNFHIGLQKTINVIEKPLRRETAQGNEAQSSVKNYSLKLKIDFQSLLDCEEKLTEKYISLISQFVDDQWKEFIKYLGLSKTVLETLESRNKNNRILCMYDALHMYVNLFPKTSLGFIIFALGEIHQTAVVEKLAQELNSNNV